MKLELADRDRFNCKNEAPREGTPDEGNGERVRTARVNDTLVDGIKRVLAGRSGEMGEGREANRWCEKGTGIGP